jgi:hypothetical protein
MRVARDVAGSGAAGLVELPVRNYAVGQGGDNRYGGGSEEDRGNEQGRKQAGPGYEGRH